MWQNARRKIRLKGHNAAEEPIPRHNAFDVHMSNITSFEIFFWLIGSATSCEKG
jgi:hypothetical protein